MTLIKFAWRSDVKSLDGTSAPSTMRNHRADLEAFVTWCEVNDRIALPASVATVCEFLED